jgi:putative transposase
LYKKIAITVANSFHLSFLIVTFKKDLRKCIWEKLKLSDNMSMITFQRKTGNGRPKGSTNLLKKPINDINEIFDILNEEQKKEIIEDWLRIQRGKKDKNT